MKDQFGRSITYLRLSLTERCTLKCAYCRAEEGQCPKQKELSGLDFIRIVRCLSTLGINKVRLTGGEPMLRKDLLEIVSGIRAIPQIGEITMTTNAQHLAGQAAALKAAGLSRLNISVDSLQPKRYHDMTAGGDLGLVLAGIDDAIQAGLTPLKLNAVLMRGVNDDEVDDFIELTKDRPIDMRFIELMPLGNEDHTGQRIESGELIAARPSLVPLPPRYAGQPSADYAMPGHMGRVGFISPMSHRFCGDCNRVRVMSDGMLRPCLGDNREVSLREALSQPDDSVLTKIMEEAIYQKPRTHGFDEAFHSQKNMSRIGG